MESNDWRPTPDQPPNNSDDGDWRSQLSSESRRRIIIKITETLKKTLPYPGQVPELNKVAARYEEKIYNVAASQEDYLRRISVKMISMETKTQNILADSLPTNPASSSRSPMELVPQNMQVQRNNQGQAVIMPSENNQPRAFQQVSAQNLAGDTASAGMQRSAGLAFTVPPVSDTNQSPISNLIKQTSNKQNLADASQNEVANSMGQGVASNVFKNQKEVLGRPQVTPEHQQFQQQYVYQQQPQQLMKQNQLQQGIISNSLMESPIQQLEQQHLLHPNQIQSSQQAANSTSNSVLHQHPQSVLRQQQHPQQTLIRNQQQMKHQSTGSSQPQQQLQTSQPLQSLMSQQTNITNMRQAQLLGKQNMSDMPQQHLRLITQQNNTSNLQQQQSIADQTNLTNIHQQRMGHQSNVSRLQQKLPGTQSSNSDMQPNQHQTYMIHQNKGPLLQQNQQTATSLLANQGPHSQPPQTHIMSHIQSESTQLQQQLGLNQQQRDMQQKLQPSGTLMQSHNIGDQQKQMYQSQRALPEASSTSTDSVSQTGHASSASWKEEVYKKITNLKEIYFTEIHELFRKVSQRVVQQPKTEQLEKLDMFRLKLKRIMQYLLVNQSEVTPAHREGLPYWEKHIVNVLNAFRPMRSGHVPQPVESIQQAQSQNMQAQSHENHINPSLQSANIQGPVMMQQYNTDLQQNSISSLSGVPNPQQNMIGSVQPDPTVDAGQGSGSAFLQQGVAGSLLQSSMNAPQQVNMNGSSSQNGVNLIQPSISNLQSIRSINQQHIKEQQLMPSQQVKHQLQQRHQQMIQNHQLQRQQLHQQSKHQPQAGLLSVNQVPQRQQVAKLNDLNMRQGFGVKPGAFAQHHAAAAGQRSVYHHQIKSVVTYPMSSPQMIQTSSPQILQNPSTQVGQQNFLPSVLKTGTPLQSANSPFIEPSPSTPLAPSPMQGDSEKLASNVSPLTTAGNIRVQESVVPHAPTQSLAIENSGISASSLLSELSNQDAAVTKSSRTDEPLDRLIKAVKSISNEAFTASVNDIGSVVSLIDRIAGSAPGNGSRAAVGEDLAAMSKCQLQAKVFATQGKSNGCKKMKRTISSMHLVVVSTDGSGNNSFTQLVGSELLELESTATSRAKRPKTEVNDSLLKEISEINQRLIDTTVDISEDVNPSIAAEVASEDSQGVIVKCSYNAVALSPDLKSQYATPQLSPIQPLLLLVPSDYPKCSPVLLDKLPVNVSNENEDLSMKAKSKFGVSLRTLSQPMSLKEIARTWDFSARAVISEYAQSRGGGSFSSTYGSWESVLSN